MHLRQINANALNNPKNNEITGHQFSRSNNSFQNQFSFNDQSYQLNSQIGKKETLPGDSSTYMAGDSALDNGISGTIRTTGILSDEAQNILKDSKLNSSILSKEEPKWTEPGSVDLITNPHSYKKLSPTYNGQMVYGDIDINSVLKNNTSILQSIASNNESGPRIQSGQRLTTELYINQSQNSKFEEPLSGSMTKKSRKASDLHG